MSRHRVLSILDGTNTVSFARGEIWVSAETLDGLGLPNETAGIVELAMQMKADICFLSCHGPQAVSSEPDALRDAVGKVQSGGFACGVVVDGPWERLSRCEGVLWVLSELWDGSHIKRNLAIEADIVCEECKAWAEAGADLVLLADDIAHSSGPYLSPARFAQLLLPRYQEIVATVTNLRVPVGFHSDGNLSLLLPALVSAGFSCFSLEPEAVSLAQFRACFGGEVTLLSGIRAAWLNQRHPRNMASPDPSIELAEVVDAGNLILASTCGLSTPDTVDALKELYHLTDRLM